MYNCGLYVAEHKSCEWEAGEFDVDSAEPNEEIEACPSSAHGTITQLSKVQEHINELKAKLSKITRQNKALVKQKVALETRVSKLFRPDQLQALSLVSKRGLQ
jgi:DNA repair exonuclease SbcCD ATPase subunit